MALQLYQSNFCRIKWRRCCRPPVDGALFFRRTLRPYGCYTCSLGYKRKKKEKEVEKKQKNELKKKEKGRRMSG